MRFSMSFSGSSFLLESGMIQHVHRAIGQPVYLDRIRIVEVRQTRPVPLTLDRRIPVPIYFPGKTTAIFKLECFLFWQAALFELLSAAAGTGVISPCVPTQYLADGRSGRRIILEAVPAGQFLRRIRNQPRIPIVPVSAV